MNVQLSLIEELLLYEFKLDHNVTEITKNVCHAKIEGLVDQCNNYMVQEISPLGLQEP